MSSIVPEGWDNFPLQDICFFQEGPGLRNWQYRDSGTKFINIRCIKDGDIDTSIAQHLSNEEVEEKYSHFLLNEGDYVLSSSGTIGRLALVKKHHLPLLLNTSVIRFRSIDETRLDSLYLRHFLLSKQFFDKISEQSQGSAQVNFGPTHLKVIDALLPPLPEQKKIASILTSVDEVIENTQKQIDKLQDLKKATMNELLTKGIGHTEFKDSELGRIPEGWSKNTINECCEILDSQRVPINSKERAKRKGKYPYYGANGVQGYIDDYIFDGDAILLAEDGGNFEQYADRPIAQWVTGKFWVNNHAHILRAKENASDKWIFYSLVHKNILKNINGGTRAKLNQSDLKEIEILLPPISEQKRILSILTSMDKNIKEKEHKLTQTQSLKKSLMQDLLTGKVRVTVN